MIRNIESKDKNGWYTLDHELAESSFYENVRNRQGYVCVEDEKVIGILRYGDKINQYRFDITKDSLYNILRNNDGRK